MELNKYIEHTLLKQDARKSEITQLLDEAVKYGFHGVCVNPVNVKYASEKLKNTDVKVVTVVGFPLGQTTSEIKISEAVDAVKNGADEIDMVLNTGKLKDGEYSFIENEIRRIKEAVRGHILKVILETDLLSPDEIKKACEICIASKADFVKTSTGFVKNGHGANVEDVKLMYETVHPFGLGVKASGGIRDKETAIKMIEAGASRLGTSSGVKIAGE